MALQFKRTRQDKAHERTFPNAKEEVIFRNDVSNKNLLKNPFRTSGIPVGPVGVQNRPINSLVDSRGNLFAQSSTVLRDHITNNNLLHNPYRFKVDPIDEPRTLSMQVIKEINNGTAPQYIRENKGIDEIAFTIIKSLPDNGVKLATISMLKSYITGLRLQSVLDQGGQNVTRAFDVLNQLIVVATNLFKTGMLNMKLPALLLDYSSNIAKVFGDTVLQPVSPMLMFSAIQDLASVSSVLSKLFKSQNAISPPTNVSIDEWSRMEAARLQSLREGERKQEAIDNNAPQIKTDGDNQPTGTQGIKDADTIKQDGSGRRYKKKKIPKTGSGLTVSWGTTSPNVPSNAPSVPVEKPSDVVNIMPATPIPVNITVKSPPLSKLEIATGVFGLLGSVATGVVGAYNAKKAWDEYNNLDEIKRNADEDRRMRRAQEGRDVLREARDNARFLDESQRFENEQLYQAEKRRREEENESREVERERREMELANLERIRYSDKKQYEIEKRRLDAEKEARERQYAAEKLRRDIEKEAREIEREKREMELAKIEKIEKLVRPWEVLNTLAVNPELYEIFDTAYSQVLSGIQPVMPRGTGYPILDENVGYINSAKNNIEFLLRLKTTLLEQQNNPNRKYKEGEDDFVLRGENDLSMDQWLRLHRQLEEEGKNEPPSAAAAATPSGYRNRKAKKSAKSTKSKIKKSKNLDAQILALLRA